MQYISNMKIMKGALLLCVLILFSISGISQIRKIEGIGVLKISKSTIDILADIADTMELAQQSTTNPKSWTAYRNGEHHYIWPIIPDTVDLYRSAPDANYCQNVKVYNISDYKIGEFVLKNISLIFFNDTLVSLKSDLFSTLKEILSIHYGNPICTSTEKEISCDLETTGINVTLTETTFYETWENNNIKAVITYYNGFKYNCNKLNFSYFLIFDRALMLKVNECDNLYKSQFVNRKKNILKEQTEGF